MIGMKWRVGNVEIFQVKEMEGGKLLQSIIPKATAKNILAIPWMTPNFADKKGKLKGLVQSFFIRSGGKNILIDTCNGNGKHRPNTLEWSDLETNYLETYKVLGFSLSDIDLVVCTHLHFDHVGWNTRKENGMWVPTFPNAKYLVAQAEYEYWKSKPKAEIEDDFMGFDDSIVPIEEAGLMELVSEDFTIDEYVRFIPTPGHTPHHMSVVIESKAEKAIITGDVFHHPCQIANLDWTSFDTNSELALDTRKKFLEEVVDTDTFILGSHFANPVGGRVVREGKSFILLV